MFKQKVLGLFVIFLFVCCTVAMAGVTQSKALHVDGRTRVITFTCVGNDAALLADGDLVVSDDNMRRIKGFFLDSVEVDPGSPAPDAAAVTVKDSFGIDLLDGNGSALIHATNSVSTIPATDSQVKLQPIFEAITIGVTGQDTADGEFLIRLIFVGF